MKLNTIALGSLALGAAAMALILYHVGVAGIIELLLQANPVFIICYLVTSILIAAVLTFKWSLVLHARGVRIPYHKLFSYRLVSYSVSYLTPTAHVGGEPIRAYLLKREGVHINTAFSTVIIDKSLEMMADVLFFFIGVLLIINSVSVAGSMKIFLLSVSLILMLLMGIFVSGILSKESMFVAIFRFFRLHRVKRLYHIEKNLSQIENEIALFYKANKEYFIAIVALIIVLWLLMFLEYRFALLIFGQLATPLQIFLILTGVGLAYSIPIPAAMGALELGQISAAKVVNLSSATGITLAFLVRTRDLVWTVLGLLFLSMYELNFMKLSRQTRAIDKEFEEGTLLRRRA